MPKTNPDQFGLLPPGDCIDLLREHVADESVQTCVTSPPYWGLRDYGCEGQLGLEATPELFVENLVAVFEEVKRVLKPDGTIWVNLGETSSSGKMGRTDDGMETQTSTLGPNGKGLPNNSGMGPSKPRKAPLGYKPKDIVGIPWMVAFALRSAGWYLRMDVIWHKPNPMPESVKDRPTRAHEYLFLLSKSERYFYDAEAIKEPVSGTAHARGNGVNPKAAKWPAGWSAEQGRHDGVPAGKYRPKQNESFSGAINELVENRNKRSVWTVPTQGYAKAHFATYPQALIRPCILASTRPGDTVLDVFAGSGTTGLEALEQGRSALLCELNPEYHPLIEERCTTTLGLGLRTDEGRGGERGRRDSSLSLPPSSFKEEPEVPS